VRFAIKMFAGGLIFGIGKGIGVTIGEELGEPISEYGKRLIFGDS